MTETSVDLSAGTRRRLLQRGLRFEYATLAWNAVGKLVLAAAAVARSVALAGLGLDSLIEIVASIVVVWQLKGIDKGSEQRALRLIGIAFVLLALNIGAQLAFVREDDAAARFDQRPERAGGEANQARRPRSRSNLIRLSGRSAPSV